MSLCDQCTCVIPDGQKMGWCERHHVKKTATWVKLCQTRPDYFRLWEEGRGPGQAKPDAWDVTKPSRGLGDTIAKITSAVGIKPCGGCKKRQAVLNKVVPYSASAADTQDR